LHILHILFISAYVAYFCLKPHVYRKGAGSSAKKQNRASPASGATPSNQSKSSLLADTSDIEVVDAEDFSAQERTDRKGRALTNSGRPSVKKMLSMQNMVQITGTLLLLGPSWAKM